MADFSEDVLQIVINMFMSDHRTRSNAVNKSDFVFRIKTTGRPKFCERTLREVIAHIRKNNLVSPGFIISNNTDGYWLSTDPKEKQAYLTQELSRMASQFENVEPLFQELRGSKPSIKQPTLFNQL